MLVIRMQRTGRKGHAMFRVVVQDSRRTPTSGKLVASLGSYDPHAKTVIIDTEKASFYLEHGAQPSSRVAHLLKAEGVKLPSWVTPAAEKQRTVRNAEKRRSTAPAEPVEETAAEEVPAAATEEAPEATPTEAIVDTPSEETAVAKDTPAEAETEAPASHESAESETA